MARHVLGDNEIMIGKKVTEFCVAVDPIMLIKVFHCPPYYMDIPECGGPRLDTMELGMSMVWPWNMYPIHLFNAYPTGEFETERGTHLYFTLSSSGCLLIVLLRLQG